MSETKFTVEGTTLIIERVFPASMAAVWKAWSTPELFAQWWGPHGWSTTVAHMDFSPGGYLLYGMKCEDEAQDEWYGQESWGKMVFGEINPQTRFTYTDYFTDTTGTITEGMPVVRTENILEEVQGGTRFVSKGTYEKPEDLKTVMDMGMQEGVSQTWDRLVSLLASTAEGA